jgi:hypothetical protein
VAAQDVAWLAEQIGEPVTILGTVTATPTVALLGARELALDELVAAFGALP